MCTCSPLGTMAGVWPLAHRLIYGLCWLTIGGMCILHPPFFLGVLVYLIYKGENNDDDN